MLPQYNSNCLANRDTTSECSCSVYISYQNILHFKPFNFHPLVHKISDMPINTTLKSLFNTKKTFAFLRRYGLRVAPFATLRFAHVALAIYINKLLAVLIHSPSGYFIAGCRPINALHHSLHFVSLMSRWRAIKLRK